MTAFSPTVYDEALFGEPLVRRVRPQVLKARSGFWIVGDWSFEFPKLPIRPAPDIQQMAIQIRDQTGWSARRLAEVLATSHTTVLQIENGRPLIQGHSGDLRRRLADAHDLVVRVFLMADREPQRTSRLIETPLPDGESPLDHLRRGDLSRAYLSAIDVLRPRTPGLLVGNRPRRDGAAAPLHD